MLGILLLPSLSVKRVINVINYSEVVVRVFNALEGENYD